jgi:pyruvoyl-dependent arginine decarboxylase (PvlArgDC)
MTKRQAKRRVCGAIALTLWNDLTHAGYIYEQDTEDDVERMREAANELYEEMCRRGDADDLLGGAG